MIDELHRTVVEGFRSVDERFARVDERFARVEERFGELRAELRKELREFRAGIEARDQEQHETTRRHFDVMVEKVEAAIRIVAEGHSHIHTIAADHETRLQAIEKRV